MAESAPVPIIPRVLIASVLISSSGSSKAATRLDTAASVATPIFPRAIVASFLIETSSSFRSSDSLGIASTADSPIFPRDLVASLHILQSSSSRQVTKCETPSAPFSPNSPRDSAALNRTVRISLLRCPISSAITVGSLSHRATTSSTFASRNSCSRVAEIFIPPIFLSIPSLSEALVRVALVFHSSLSFLPQAHRWCQQPPWLRLRPAPLEELLYLHV